MLKIRLNSHISIYEQVVDEIKRMIKTGELKEGDSLPTIRSLAGQLEVDKNTIARAYQELYNEGIIVSNRRKGSYIKKSSADLPLAVTKIFKEQIIKLIKNGLNKNEIEKIFYDNLNQIFD